VGKAGALEVEHRARVDTVVFAEDEPAQQRRLGVRSSALEGRFPAIPDPVGDRRQASAPPASELEPPGDEDARDPEPGEVGRLPVLGGAEDAAGADLATHGEVGDRLVGHREQAPVGGGQPDPDLAIGAPRHRGDEAVESGRRAERTPEGPGIDRGDADRTEREPGCGGTEGERQHPGDGGRGSPPPAAPARAVARSSDGQGGDTERGQRESPGATPIGRPCQRRQRQAGRQSEDAGRAPGDPESSGHRTIVRSLYTPVSVVPSRKPHETPPSLRF
jgi:hypothetical protein